MLVELMVVSVAVLILFIAVYTNFYPSMGEYENRIYYNNLETEYALFYTKVMYLKYFHENEDIEKDFFSNNLSNSYVNLIENGNCNNFNFSTNFLNKCNLLANTYEIDTVILTTYDTSNIKNVSITDEKLSKYINYIPNYNSEDELYRLIIKTNYGYGNSNFYSKKCDPYVYSEWEYSFKPCEVEEGICERVNQLYINIGKWTSEEVCTPNENNVNLCETATTLYRTKIDDNWGDYEETPCDETLSTCEKQEGTFYRQNEFTENPEMACMSSDEQKCEARLHGYKSRIKTENELDKTNFSVSVCSY